MPMNRRIFLASTFALAGASIAIGRALAAEPAVFTGLITGVGAGGYDVVAYFSENSAKPGDPAITALHQDVTYRFTSAANRDAFAAEPAKYLPAYGGYCAYAAAKGSLASSDPEAFTVADGRLFLNYSKSIRKTWLQDVKGYVAAADAQWPAILGQ
jgi:hypothetical protein